jgi:DNA (cytosine-5)-methyltransferase 1
MKVADFFCGGGGFSEGFRQAGFQLVFAVDKWKPAVETYKGNKPGVNVLLDDVIRISYLNDDEFEKIVPDSEVIIGSPPCQAFSQSNKSGNADKTLGIQLIEAYLRIVARKKFKNNSILKYWVLENVPNSQKYIKEKYTAQDLELEGDFTLYTRCDAAGIYNAKNFGAPTNRRRFLCGDFPALEQTHKDDEAVKLKTVLNSLGNPLAKGEFKITDVNYPDLVLSNHQVTDFHYVHELAPFEWKTAKRLKQDKGYMGKMSFPENENNPARTVMATMSASSREAMILRYEQDRYRLPTVREAASMMSFPIDYKFYGSTRGIKHTLVGNAVPPKLSYAIAKAIAKDSGMKIPKKYIPIQHNPLIDFVDLNGSVIPIKMEKPRRDVAKFKYHIPYLIINAFRVELTNYHSDFKEKNFQWDAELHYSQGKKRAAVYKFDVTKAMLDEQFRKPIEKYINEMENQLFSFNDFQKVYCKTTEQREASREIGPYELLENVRNFIDCLIIPSERNTLKTVDSELIKLPNAIIVGYYLLQQLVKRMGEKVDGCDNKKKET